MKSSAEIFNELNNISSLVAGIEKKNVFSVPEGYFDELCIDVIKRVNSGTSSVTDKLSVPEGYFENLSASVLNRIKSLKDDPAQELRELSPMLYSIQNENVFTVPAGYFRDLENEILNKIKPQAKIVQFKKRNSVWKYAAAAVVTGFIGISSLMMFNASEKADKLKEGSILEAIEVATEEFDNPQKVNAAIATLSDDEIIKYLEKTGNEVDNEVLTTNFDDKALPAPNDYLMDEKILDAYINQTDRKSQN